MPLTFEDQQGLISFATGNTKEAIKKGLTKQEYTKEVDDSYIYVSAIHEAVCDNSIDCVFEESFKLIRETVLKVYNEKTVFDADEIDRLAKELLKE